MNSGKRMMPIAFAGILLSGVTVDLIGKPTAFADVSQPTVSETAHLGPLQRMSVEKVEPQSPALAKQARSAVIMEPATGKVLFAKNEHTRMPMASITKIMTMLLVMEAVDSGKLKLTDRVRASDYAASMGGSQIFLESGEEMTVQDLMKGIAMASANDACVALAEHLSGTVDNFVMRMNARAASLGMKDTHFANCNGLPAANHYSSAYDIALMTRALLEHPQITTWTSIYSDYLRKESARPLWLVNTNKLVRFYDGLDGMKTGYTSEAKYCLSATAKKHGMRMIAVVLGEPKPTVRNGEVTSMLNWAFAQYEFRSLYKRGDIVGQCPVKGGRERVVAGMVNAPVGAILERGQNAAIEKTVVWNEVRSPIKKGDRIGTLNVKVSDRWVGHYPIFAVRDVEKATLMYRVGRAFQSFFSFGKTP
ncbi:D-alanyl-D-alanine carboxypeptidase family protein [Alicyclobacillus sp. SP_1]|uniref:D-alanyl-D-alanine carboxypeptidase family protein n=1 Tax=Alicyclobacillus sp. SP_1 TaxID=2942475 RepID=UPI0021574939|nr:D-alanyl-D-alanine carboxypeptidase family protein [Alicyclobacillus sp. SP_1]